MHWKHATSIYQNFHNTRIYTTYSADFVSLAVIHCSHTKKKLNAKRYGINVGGKLELKNIGIK